MGKPQEFKFEKNEDFKYFYGFCEVKVKSKNISALPIHAHYKNQKLIFQHFKDYETLYLYSEEIRLGMKHDIYEYNFEGCKGLHFTRKKAFLKDFFEDCFKNKAKAKSEGNDVMELVYKIIANSGYGFWGLKYANRECIKTTKDETLVQMYYEKEKLIDFAQFGNHYSIKVEDDLPMKDFNVSIASSITSYARMELWNAINDIKNKGYNVHYCDTDSIVTDCPINIYEDLMNRYCWDGKGEELGTLKNECYDKIVKYNKKNPNNIIDIQKQLELDNGVLHFDEVIIKGCKFYGIKKTCYNGAIIEIVKCKGYRTKDKELTFDDFVNGDIIKQNQLQFSIPKSSLHNEITKYGVSKREVEKVFKPTYNKGDVDKESGKVISFYK